MQRMLSRSMQTQTQREPFCQHNRTMLPPMMQHCSTCEYGLPLHHSSSWLSGLASHPHSLCHLLRPADHFQSRHRLLAAMSCCTFLECRFSCRNFTPCERCERRDQSRGEAQMRWWVVPISWMHKICFMPVCPCVGGRCSVLHARGPRGGPVVGASSGEAPSRTTHTDYFVLPNVFIFLRRL